MSIESKLLSLSIVLASYLLFKWWRSRPDLRTNIKSLPQPVNGDWLYGHEKQAWDSPNHQFFLDNIAEHGHVFRMKAALFHPDILFVADPAAMASLFLKDTFTYRRASVIRPLVERLAGRSILLAEGQEHRQIKDKLTPLFTHGNVKRMEPEVKNAADKLVHALEQFVHERSKKNEPIDIDARDWPDRATLDVIGAVGFGYDFKCGASPEAEGIHQAWWDVVKMDRTFTAFIAPCVLRAFPFIVHLPFKAIQAQGQVRTIVHRLGQDIVEERRKLHAVTRADSAASERDLLSTLLRISHGEDFTTLLDHITGFVLAGNETTSTSLSFALYALSQDRQVQDKLRREIMDFQTSFGRDPTYNEWLTGMPYMDAVCKEVMRLYAPPGNNARVAVKDDILPLQYPVRDPKTGEEITEVRIKAGQAIIFSYTALNRNTTVWGPDGDQFKPDRWLDQSSPYPTHKHGWNGTFSFAYGPRMCMGIRMALFEFKVILSALLKSFEFLPAFDPVTGEELKVHISMSATTMIQPFVVGKKSEGPKIPIRVRSLA